MRAIWPIPILLVAALASSCGGSTATSNDEDDPNAFNLFSVSSLDGDIDNVGVVDATGDEMDVGLQSTGRQHRAFATFDISQFNVNDNVNSAGVSLTFVSQEGSPFTTFGSIIVEDVDIAGSLTSLDYDLPAINGSVAMNSFSHVADVGPIVQAAISAGQARITFRFRFANPLAPVGVFVTYATGESALPPPLLGIVLGEPNP